jgi:hypothetical protein
MFTAEIGACESWRASAPRNSNEFCIKRWRKGLASLRAPPHIVPPYRFSLSEYKHPRKQHQRMIFTFAKFRCKLSTGKQER